MMTPSESDNDSRVNFPQCVNDGDEAYRHYRHIGSDWRAKRRRRRRSERTEKEKKDSLSGRASKAAAGKLTDKNKKTWREERELFDSRQTNDTIHYRDEVIIPNNNNNNNMNSSGATDVKNPNGPFLFFPVFHDGWISSVRLAGQNNDNVLIY